jgi:hypothetical protein
MTALRRALLTGAILFLYAPQAPAEPIFKARKYEGHIPQNTLSLRVGMFGGASNQEMIDYLDVGVQQPFQVTYEDMGTGLAFDLEFIHKPHPRFGVRVNASLAFDEYTSTGDFVPQTEDSLLPQLEYDRKLKVDLFVIEGSGIYFFSDAATSDLQTFLGAGFSVGIPHEVFTEDRTDVDTGEPYTDDIPGRPHEASEWGVNAGVHAVAGMMYYFDPRWGVSAQARLQFMESKFDALQANDPETGEFENVSFVIDYSGFYFSIGATYGF